MQKHFVVFYSPGTFVHETVPIRLLPKGHLRSEARMRPLSRVKSVVGGRLAAGRQGDVPPAVAAAEDARPVGEAVRFLAARAVRAGEALAPTHRLKVGGARRVVGEHGLELGQGSGEAGHDSGCLRSREVQGFDAPHKLVVAEVASEAVEGSPLHGVLAQEFLLRLEVPGRTIQAVEVVPDNNKVAVLAAGEHDAALVALVAARSEVPKGLGVNPLPVGSFEWQPNLIHRVGAHGLALRHQQRGAVRVEHFLDQLPEDWRTVRLEVSRKVGQPVNGAGCGAGEGGSRRDQAGIGDSDHHLAVQVFRGYGGDAARAVISQDVQRVVAVNDPRAGGSADQCRSHKVASCALWLSCHHKRSLHPSVVGVNRINRLMVLIPCAVVCKSLKGLSLGR